MKHVRVYREDVHVGYFLVDENDPPKWIVNDAIFLYQLRPKGGLIQNHCYELVGQIEVQEIDNDID